MKKFIIIFISITIIFLLVGSISYILNDADKIYTANEQNISDYEEVIWQYPIYEQMYNINCELLVIRESIENILVKIGVK